MKMKINYISKKIVSCIQKDDLAGTPILQMIRRYSVNIPCLLKYKEIKKKTKEVEKNPEKVKNPSRKPKWLKRLLTRKKTKEKPKEKAKTVEISSDKKTLKRLPEAFEQVFREAVNLDRSLKESVKQLKNYLLVNYNLKKPEYIDFLDNLQVYFNILRKKPKEIQLRAFNIFPKGAERKCLNGDRVRLSDAIVFIHGEYPIKLITGCIQKKINIFSRIVPSHSEVHIQPFLLRLAGDNNCKDSYASLVNSHATVFDAYQFMENINEDVNQEFAEALKYLYYEAVSYNKTWTGTHLINIEEQELYKYICVLDDSFRLYNYFIEEGFKKPIFDINGFFQRIQKILISNGFISKKEDNRLSSIKLEDLFLKEEKLEELKGFTKEFIKGDLNDSEANSLINILYCLKEGFCGKSDILAQELRSVFPCEYSWNIKDIINSKMKDNPYYSKNKVETICSYPIGDYPNYCNILQREKTRDFNFCLNRESSSLIFELLKGNAPIYLFEKHVGDGMTKTKCSIPMKHLCLNPGFVKIKTSYEKYLDVKNVKYDDSLAFFVAKFDRMEHLKLVPNYQNILSNILETAITYESLNVIRALITEYPGLNADGQLVNNAIKNGSKELVQAIAEVIDPKQLNTPFEGNTPAYIAAEKGFADIFRILAEKIDDPWVLIERTDKMWETPLHIAVRKGNLNIVTIINDKIVAYCNGKKETRKNLHKKIFSIKSYGKTSLMIAIQKGEEKIIKVILEPMEFTKNECDTYKQYVPSNAPKEKIANILSMIQDVPLEKSYYHEFQS
ncbi:ankyrin repeat domain-containing protein [Candidatus Margulisiibacteriota bacterium]